MKCMFKCDWIVILVLIYFVMLLRWGKKRYWFSFENFKVVEWINNVLVDLKL